MHPRHLIDVGFDDLLAAARFRPGRDEPAPLTWPAAGDRAVIACLSVRTGWDALLQALELPPGSEVAASAVNVSDMGAIVAAHDLVLRPVDICPSDLAPRPEALAAAIGPRTRVLLVAHLYGAVAHLGPAAALAARHGALLVEDCAQAWSASFRGSPEADVSLFSFGPIKTSTALGGAVLTVREPALARAVAAQLRAHAPLPDAWHRKRLLKYAAFKLAAQPPAYGALAAALQASGRDLEATVGSAARGFGDGPLLPQIRRAPPVRLLHLLGRRVAAGPADGARRERAERLISLLERPEAVPGRRASAHSRWVNPVLARSPDELIAALRAASFDATRGATSLRVLAGGDTASAERLLRHAVYLPAVSAMPHKELRRLAAVLNAADLIPAD